MSEYTQYFIVKSSSELEVKQKMNKAKILSIIDSDKKMYWFTDEYKNKNASNWIVVSAPADSGFKNGEFYYKDKFEDISKIFEIVIFFFEEENASDWRIHLKHDKGILFKEFYAGKDIPFTETEKQIMEEVFEKEFKHLERFLKPGKSADFLNFNGISYMEMNNQNQLGITNDNENYSFLASELGDGI